MAGPDTFTNHSRDFSHFSTLVIVFFPAPCKSNDGVRQQRGHISTHAHTHTHTQVRICNFPFSTRSFFSSFLVFHKIFHSLNFCPVRFLADVLLLLLLHFLRRDEMVMEKCPESTRYGNTLPEKKEMRSFGGPRVYHYRPRTLNSIQCFSVLFRVCGHTTVFFCGRLLKTIHPTIFNNFVKIIFIYFKCTQNCRMPFPALVVATNGTGADIRSYQMRAHQIDTRVRLRPTQSHRHVRRLAAISPYYNPRVLYYTHIHRHTHRTWPNSRRYRRATDDANR